MTSISLIISDYAKEEEASYNGISLEVKYAWDKVWKEATDERFLSWLISERIIDFCGEKAKTDGVNLFSKHIVPLLLDAASTPPERELLYTLACKLQASGFFLTVIPKFGSTSASDGGSFSSRAIRGTPAAFAPNRPTKETFTKDSLKIFMQAIDSYVVELLLDNRALELLENTTGAWHLGVTASRSSLLHELIHVVDMTDGTRKAENNSYRWTDVDEEQTIQRENEFLKARGESVRVSHNTPSKFQEYMDQSSTERLQDALFLAADGTVRELVEKGWTSLEDSLAYDEKNLKGYAIFYLEFFVQIQSEDIDRPFKNEMKFHKNVALEHMVTSLLEKHPEGKKLANRLLEKILEEAPKHNCLDAIAYVQRLKMYFGME